jgi:predicted AlkP superfamily pyrophosphatase or phosphodiesterase
MPRLVVLLSVDQLSPHRLDPALPGGLGRLVREGRSFARGELAHAISETCPGHVALATGVHPGRAGVPANYTLDREASAIRYCLEDDPATTSVIGSDGARGRSPRRLRVDTLGGWMKASNARSRVFSVSAKDRSAIALAGYRPDGAYWLEKTGEIGFSTSRYYTAELPAWVRDFNGADPARGGFLSKIPERWDHARGTHGARGRADDYPHELGAYSRTSGHPLRDDQLEVFALQVYASPWADTVTLDFALRLMREEALGSDAIPDLLAISLSASDVVGHAYGPESHEAADALRRLDADLGEFLARLEESVGRDRLLVALSSDHGVLPVPEWLAETGRETCPVDGGRISLDRLRLRLRLHMNWELGGWFPWPGRWTFDVGTHFAVDRARALREGVDVERAVATAEAWLEAQPGIVEAWTAEEIAQRQGPMADRYRRSFDRERSGDLVVQPAEGCLLSTRSSGTSHGAPYGYDTNVPIVFWGAGVEGGVDDRPAATVDVAPTLARALGLELRADLDGRPLPLRSR